MKHVLLDSYPLSVASNPSATANVLAMRSWATSLLAAGRRIYIPEVIDYELRRELLRAGKAPSIAVLDVLKGSFHYVPITTAAMLLAATLWARMRNSGIATGDSKKLDIDVILAAQALTLGVPEADLIVATSSVAHLARFVAADLWSNITS